jgi:uncharacterized Zn finger protein
MFIEENANERAYAKGLQLFRNNNVILLILNGDELYAEVKGTKPKPYQIVFTLDTLTTEANSKRGRIKKAVCECAYTGEGWCKHIVAVLFCIAEKHYTHEYTLHNNPT